MDYKHLAEDFLCHMRKHTPPLFDEPGKYSRGKIGILIYLQDIQDGVTPGELSRHFSVSTGRIAAALKRLEKEGLLHRRTDDIDNRKSSVSITDEGREFVHQSYLEGVAKIEEQLSKLEITEARELIRLLKKFMS